MDFRLFPSIFSSRLCKTMEFPPNDEARNEHREQKGAREEDEKLDNDVGEEGVDASGVRFQSHSPQGQTPILHLFGHHAEIRSFIAHELLSVIVRCRFLSTTERIFCSAIVVKNHRTCRQIFGITRHGISEIGNSLMLRCHIPLSGVEIPTLAGACIPAIESAERTSYPMVCIFLLQHIGAHEAHGRFVVQLSRCTMEIARCEKAEGCLQQPAMMMTIVAYHAQIVPPRIGIMFMRQRKWLMPKSGYGHQERRTKKHPRYGE